MAIQHDQEIRCPECGAIWRDGFTCQDVFDHMIVLEFSNPIAGSVHYYTVTCFMMQHNRYADAAFADMFPQLTALVNGEKTLDEVRVYVHRTAAQDKRTYSIIGGSTRKPREWSLTILDAYTTEMDQYVERVMRWARSIVDDLTAEKA